ncbi:MAG: acylneuraminate cytidylyltransferase family protein [Synergistaceae bacterium]|nr:acylneuraminate cytidylyltransferase family protein [Synergistaceae bacterium]
MYKNKKSLAVITARGGSKRLPKKNVRLLGAMPLIAWTMTAALESRFLDRVILSSDDAEIIAVAREFGCEVPFVRPDSLAQDSSTSADVLLHAIGSLEDRYDYAVLLQPTSPFRMGDDIDAAVRLCVDSGAPSVVTVQEAREKPEWMCLLDERGRMRFPYAPSEGQPAKKYILNGAVYVVSTDWFERNRVFLTSETRAMGMSWERSVDIDTMEDWLLAEHILEKRTEKQLGTVLRHASDTHLRP